MEKPIKMDDLGVTPIFGNIHMLPLKDAMFVEMCLMVWKMILGFLILTLNGNMQFVQNGKTCV